MCAAPAEVRHGKTVSLTRTMPDAAVAPRCCVNSRASNVVTSTMTYALGYRRIYLYVQRLLAFTQLCKNQPPRRTGMNEAGRRCDADAQAKSLKVASESSNAMIDKMRSHPDGMKACGPHRLPLTWSTPMSDARRGPRQAIECEI